MHGALAEATDPAADPDRRAWHRAQAAAGPDEEVAAELERSAGRAQARGGLAAAAAFLERAVRLTADPARLVERTLAAAQASVQAGAFDKALGLLVMAEAWPLDELASARVDLLRGQVAFASGMGSDAPPLLLKAARRLEPLNLDLARETYLDAWGAAFFAGRLAARRIWRRSPAPPGPCPGRRHPGADGTAARRPGAADHRRTGRRGTGVAAGSQRLRQRPASPSADGLRWGWLATAAATLLWDDDGWRAILARQVQLARNAGALEHLPIDLAGGGPDHRLER